MVLSGASSIRKAVHVAVERLPSSLHCFAGVLLLLFAFSHFAFLRISGFEGTLPNPVFPFFSNNDLYLAAGILEEITAVACFRFQGREFTNVIILAFVAMMLLYRWAFNFVGGAHCGCLGLLAKLLHVNKSREKIIADMALLYLALTTMPWICSRLKTGSRRPFSQLTLRLVIAFSAQSVFGASSSNLTIEVYGTYTATAQNPQTGRLYLDYRHVHAAFGAVLCGPAWKISVTNLDAAGGVGQIWCDGTNTFALQPADALDTVTFTLKSGPHTTNIVTVSPTLYYVGTYDPDYLDMSLPWLTYGLNSSAAAQADAKGVVALPVPWMQPRSKPSAYGYKWIISWAGTDGRTDRRFAQTLSVVRDTALDLDNKKSLLRPDLVYPGSLGQYNRDLGLIHWVKTFTNGFVEAQFQCVDWRRIEYGGNNDSVSVPSKSEFKYFDFDPRPPYSYPHPLFEGKLYADRVVIHENRNPKIYPKTHLVTDVVDFRYRRATDMRIYRAARYTLQPGDAWKSADDAALLAQAAYYLKHGPRYDSYLNKRNYLAWLLFGIIALMLVTFVLWSKHKKNNTTQRKL